MSLSIDDVLNKNNWKADVEKKNDLSAKEPECMKQLDKAVPGRKELTATQAEDAKKELFTKSIAKFQREMKSRNDPPINGQYFGLVSFIPSKGASPDKDGSFGVMKFRGAFSNPSEAETWAEHLLRDHDTTAEIDVVHIGKHFPLLVDNTAFCDATREIDIRKKIDDTVKADIRAKKQEEQKQIDEVTKRQQKLLDKSLEEEKDTTYTDIDFYTQLRVKKAQNLSLIDDARKRIEEAEAAISSTQVEIDKLDADHPEYAQNFLDNYTRALAEVGTKATDNPLIKYLQ